MHQSTHGKHPPHRPQEARWGTEASQVEEAVALAMLRRHTRMLTPIISSLSIVFFSISIGATGEVALNLKGDCSDGQRIFDVSTIESFESAPQYEQLERAEGQVNGNLSGFRSLHREDVQRFDVMDAEKFNGSMETLQAERGEEVLAMDRNRKYEFQCG